MTTKSEIIAAENCWIGLNGTKEEGWHWSDGSKANFNGSTKGDFENWENGARYKADRIESDQCVKTLNDGSWRKTECADTTEQCFVCGFKRRERRTLRGEQNLTLQYTPSELPLPLINITFVFNETRADKDKSKERYFPGFRVTWKASKTSVVTELDRRQWKPHLFHHNHREVSFLLTVSLVKEVLKTGVTWVKLRDSFFTKRGEYIKSRVGCEEGYLPEHMYLGLLEYLRNDANASMTINDVYPSNGDLQKFLRVYLLLSQCSEEAQKGHQFINNHRDRPGTLLQGVVNTQNRNIFQENSTRVYFRKFYSVLERELDLEHGKLLLALGSPTELEAIIKKDLPFLDRYRTEVTTCLHEVIQTPQVQDL